MATAKKPTLKIYTELERSYFQAPSARALALCEHLRSHGVTTHSPMAVSMGIHSMELPFKSDLKAIQGWIDQWAKDSAPPPQVQEEKSKGTPRTSMFAQ